MDSINRHDNAPPLADRLALDYESLGIRAVEAAGLAPDKIRSIANDEEAGAYADVARDIKAVAAAVEKARKTEKEEVLHAGRTIDAFFGRMLDPLKARIDAVIAALNVFQRAKLETERRAQAAAAELARKEAEQAAKEAALFDEPAPVATPAPPPVVVREAARVVSDSGTKATASRKWVHAVEDADAVPRQYLMVNDAAIKAAIAGGVRKIDGVRIYEDVRTSIR